MPRINTYPPDAILQNEDLILGSDYKGTVNGVPIYETKSFSLNSLANYLSRYVYVNPNIYDLELIYTNLENINAANTRIDETITTITTVQTNLQNQIATDLADLQSQTEQSITLLDTTLNSAISDVADTITTEVSNLNDRILQGETDLAADIVALGDTITTETQNLTTLINTETGLIADTVANLDNSITLQLGELNTDIAGALQQAIDAGELAVEAQASISEEVIARTSAVGAVAGKVETIETQFTFSTEDGSIVGTSGALSETITTTASTAAGAVATRVDILETEYVLDTNDGSILGLSENSITNVALTTVTGAVATRVDTIETQFTITDGVVTGFSQAARDRIDTSISNATSAQFQTLDAIKTQFVFTNGDVTAVSDVIQTSITDSISNATSAQFTKLDEVATQFVFDGNSITGVQGAVSSTINSAKLEAISTADTAAQNKVDTFAAKIVTTDANGNVTGLSDAVQTSVSNVVAQDGYATSGQLTTLSSSVGLIPRIYRQNDPPSLTTTPIGSLWFDTNNNNKSYVLVAGTPNVWTTVQDTELTAFKASATQDIQTNATNTSANATRITNLNATLDILNADGTVKKNTADFFQDIRTDVDANSATASKVDTLETTVGDANSGLVASVTSAQSAIATVDGKLTASYGLSVNAGGKVAGLKLLANGSTGSNFIAQANEFGVEMPNGTRVLTVNSTGLNVVGSGTFTGNITAASGTFGGWEIDEDALTSPKNGLGFSTIKFDPTGGLTMHDIIGNTRLFVRREALSDVSVNSTLTFADLNDIALTSWVGPIFANNFDEIVKTTGTTYKASTINTPGATGIGYYTGQLNLDAMTDIATTSSNFSGFLSIAVIAEIAEDSNFLISPLSLAIGWAQTSSPSTTLSIPAMTGYLGYAITSSTNQTLYIRFKIKRTLTLSSGYVVFSSKTTNVVSSDLPFNMTKTTLMTELTEKGILVSSGSSRYFKVDRDVFFGKFAVVKGGIDVTGGISTDFISKGSGSFTIDHPLPEMEATHNLVHSFVESPQANNIYRGQVNLVNGQSIINLDEASGMTEGTFVALNRDIHTFTSNESDWDHVRGTVAGNILTIECQNPESTAKVSWLVIGERHDKHMFDTHWTDENGKVIVEPLKQDSV